MRTGIVTPGVNRSDETLRQLPLPDRCDGMRVLDVGTRDGYFAFELERRGAEVLALDYVEPELTGFPVAKELLGSNVEYTLDNVYNVTPDRYGRFDLVLLLGVLYHLRDPLLALDRMWDACTDGGSLVVETQLLDHAVQRLDGSFGALDDYGDELEALCLAQFYPRDALGGDHTNYWAPNAACMRALLDAAGFELTHEVVSGSRGIFQGRRITDPTQLFQRRLEKTTLDEARTTRLTAAAPVELTQPAQPEAPLPAAADDERLIHLQTALSSLEVRERAAQGELEGARRHIAALDAELARKERDLRAMVASADAGSKPPRRAGGLVGALKRALRGR